MLTVVRCYFKLLILKQKVTLKYDHCDIHVGVTHEEGRRDDFCSSKLTPERQQEDFRSSTKIFFDSRPLQLQSLLSQPDTRLTSYRAGGPNRGQGAQIEGRGPNRGQGALIVEGRGPK
jgi:hypothetical protein